MFTCFTGVGIKSVWPIFKNKMSIYQPKANLDEKNDHVWYNRSSSRPKNYNNGCNAFV